MWKKKLRCGKIESTYEGNLLECVCLRKNIDGYIRHHFIKNKLFCVHTKVAKLV